MHAFWRRGFEATSVVELEAATGLNKSSLYNTFASKEALFQRCLERYGACHGQALLDQLAAADLFEALEGFFNALLSRFDDPSVPNGCMSTIAAMEPVAAEGAVAASVSSAVETVRRAFAKRLNEAKASGALRADAPTEDLAALLTATARGLAVLDRVPDARGTARQAVRGALAAVRALAA